MSLLHPAMLFGLLLAVIPVALHLLLRARPKRLVFPALRLLQQRRMQNQRRMQLRHLWLLLLRMGLIAVLVCLVARPSLPPANYAPTWGELLGLAAILAFAAAAYFVTLTLWLRRRVPQYQLLTRRTYLRGGLGMFALLLALLLVGWPYQRRVAAEITSPAPAALDNLPVAAVFVCDTSLSMTYQYEGTSRLVAARSIAVAHLQRLPPGSQGAVLDAGGDVSPVMSPDLTAVQNRMESLVPRAVTPSLNEQLRAAIRFQSDEHRRALGAQSNVAEDRRRDQFVREIYLFTDLAKSAWRVEESQSLAAELAEHPWLGIYLIDVGIEQPVNVGIVDLRLSRQTVGKGGQVAIEATVRAAHPASSEATVELWHGTDGQPFGKRDQQTVPLSAAQSARVLFQSEELTGTLLQGEIRVVGADPLVVDDVSHFSVQVLEPLSILVVSPSRAMAGYWLEAVQGLSAVGSAYHAQLVTPDRLATANLEEVDVVCLINVPQPRDEDWQKLTTFAGNGGGVLVFLGAASSLSAGNRQGIDPLAYATEAAQALLPMRPKASLVFSPPRQLNFRDSPHPLTLRLETLGVLAQLGDVDFHRYWSVEPTPDSVTLARWTDDSAQSALLLREVGRGRCAVFTSSVDSAAWSGWLRDWTFVVATDQWLQLLSRQAASRHTLIVGDPVVLPVAGHAEVASALLRQPDLTQRRVDILSGSREIALTDLEHLGNYQVVTAGTPPELLTGFSLNLPATETDLTRFSSAELDQLLGVGRYSVARDPEQLTKSVLAGRFGQEISGLLLAVLVAVFVVEQSTATWFYRQDDSLAPG